MQRKDTKGGLWTDQIYIVCTLLYISHDAPIKETIQRVPPSHLGLGSGLTPLYVKRKSFDLLLTPSQGMWSWSSNLSVSLIFTKYFLRGSCLTDYLSINVARRAREYFYELLHPRGQLYNNPL